MDFKKYLFFIIVGIFLLIIFGAYVWIVPSINSDANVLLEKINNQAGILSKMARQSEQPDAIKTRKHLEDAKEYDEKISAQLSDFQELLAIRLKLDQRFADAPKASSEFDIWLETLRNKMLAKAKQANLKISVPTDKLLFTERTSDTASENSLHRDYRLRHLAITQEIWDILCAKWTQQTAPTFTPEGAEKQVVLELGALELEKLVIGATRVSGDLPPYLLDAYKRAKGSPSAAASSASSTASAKKKDALDLPYTCVSVDAQFVAPFLIIPHILKALEKSDRYLAVITRLDYQRATVPYPLPANEKGLEIAGPIPALNTYYLEGPVRVLVTMDLYEYDKSKEDKYPLKKAW